MRLTLHSDLAFRTLLSLAMAGQEGCNISQIAEVHRASENHLRKVVYHLAKAGLVETTRGRGGGLRLAIPASKITIGTIVRHMEPDFALADCLSSDPERCSLAGLCGVQQILSDALKAWFEILDHRSLADAVAGTRGFGDRSASGRSNRRDTENPSESR
jgi:Rrf2 family transcriptional regulator, nitric oxide-sensitive transcriptional repressor